MITAIEVTTEEMEMIMKKREADAKDVAAKDLFEHIKEELTTLQTLGYNIALPSIGGQYVPRHCPTIRCIRELHLSRR